MRFLLFVLMVFQIGCGTKTETKTKTVDNTETHSIYKHWVEYPSGQTLQLDNVDEDGYFYNVINNHACRPHVDITANEITISDDPTCTILDGTYDYSLSEDTLVIFDGSEATVFTSN